MENQLRKPQAKSEHHWRILGSFVVVLATCVSCFGQEGHPATSLSAQSPLVTDGSRLFAVAADDKTILVRPTSLDADWKPLHVDAEIQKVGGLALDRGSLFVSDSEGATVVRVDLDSGRHEVLHHGRPLQRPRRLAVGDALFVADAEAEQVFRVSLQPGVATIEPVKELAGMVRGEVALSYRGDTLVYAEGDSILRVTGAAEQSTKTLRALQRQDSSSTRPQLASRTSYKGRNNIDYPRIDHPTSVAAFNGLIYAVSGTTGLVYSTSRLLPRAVNSTFGLNLGERRRFREVAVADEWLFALDADRGDVVRWRRPVPTQFTMQNEPSSECMSEFFNYLTKHDALPSREVPLRSSLEKTLREEEVLKSPYVTSLDAVICDLNRKVCVGGKPRAKLAANQLVNIPDLFVEALLAHVRAPAKGFSSFGKLVDAWVPSDTFAYARGEDFLRALNHVGSDEPDLRSRKPSGLYAPKEVIRYTVAVPAEDVRNGRVGAAFDGMRRWCPGITINPLERREAAASATGSCVAADFAVIDQAHTALLNTIHFGNPLAAPPVDVAVVEDGVDVNHPDFVSDGGGPFENNDSTARAAMPTAPSAATMRCWDDSDHGTAVASLIGAQNWHASPGTVAGLAPDARLILFATDLASLGDSIATSPASSTIAVMNYSRASGKDDNLLNAIKFNQPILFVVDAGNSRDAREVCEHSEKLVYPACYEAQFENVLVVGATTLDGQHWLDTDGTIEGANWSPKHVHVAAPGDGYWAEGKGNSYVPVRGTSFATPLVASTAARLAAQNVWPPWKIKYRIIATSDPTPGFEDKVMGGLLNVQQAVTAIRQTVIKRGGQAAAVFLVAGPELQILIDGKVHRPKPDHILRLTKRGPVYRILYEDESEHLFFSANAKLPANMPLTIRYRVADPVTGSAIGPFKSESLSGVEDFIGAVPTWMHTRT